MSSWLKTSSHILSIIYLQGYEVLNTFTFRITRNADLTIHEDGAEDLLIEIERFLKERKSGSAVRLEVDGRTENPDDLDWLIETLKLISKMFIS